MVLEARKVVEPGERLACQSESPSTICTSLHENAMGLMADEATICGAIDAYLRAASAVK